MAPTQAFVLADTIGGSPGNPGLPLLEIAEGGTYHEAHKQYTRAYFNHYNEALKQTVLYLKRDTDTLRKDRFDPGKRFESSKGWSAYFPYVWRSAGHSATIIICEGEKAAAALMHNPFLNAYSIWSVGPVWGFKNALFNRANGFHLIFWYDTGPQGEPEGATLLAENMRKRKDAPLSLRRVVYTKNNTDAADYTHKEQLEFIESAEYFVIPSEQHEDSTPFDNTQSTGNEDAAQCLEYLKQVSPVGMQHDEWWRWMCASHAVGITEEEFDTWSHQDSEKYQAGVVKKKWATIDGSVKRGTFFHLLREKGIIDRNPVSENSGNRNKQKNAYNRNRKNTKSDDGWIMGREAPATGSRLNAKLALSALGFDGKIKYNVWDDKSYVDGIEVSDKKVIEPLGLQIEEHFQQDKYVPTSSAISSVVHTIALENRYDSAVDYLMKCYNNWDGKYRIDNLGENMFAQNGDILYNQIVGLILHGQIHRIMAPGCILPYVPIITGNQGVNKGESIKLLSVMGSVEGLELTGFDTQRKMLEKIMGNSTVELAELQTLNRGALAFLKSITTDVSIRARLSYDKEPTTWLFRHMVIATTNQLDFLADTEHRRNPVIEIPHGEKIELEGLREIREQLFGEAVQKFKDGNYWSPEKENYIVTLDEGLWEDANVDSSMYESISPYDTYVGKALEYYFEHLLPIPNSAIWMNTELLEHASEAFYDYKVKTALYKVGYKPCKKKLKNLDTDKWERHWVHPEGDQDTQ